MSTLLSSAVAIGDGEITIADRSPSPANKASPATDRPFIAAIVITKARGGLPAPGFFDCAARLGRFDGEAAGPEAWAFHAAELNAAVAFWAASGSPDESGLNDRQGARQASTSNSEQET